jgi:hypothetical protein
LNFARRALSLGGAAMLLAGCFGPTTGVPAARGLGPLQTGQAMTGPSGLYTITLPDNRWTRVPPGTLSKDTDLELYRSSPKTWAVAYVKESQSWTLDEIVAVRRDVMKTNFGRFGFQEERQLLPGLGVPISYARYTNEGAGRATRQSLWVATVVRDGSSVEVIASTVLAGEAEDSVERLVKSMELVTAKEEP